MTRRPEPTPHDKKKRRRDVAIFWLIVFIAALAAAFIIARPLLLSEAASAPAGESAEARLDAALAAIRRDLDCGLMDTSAAKVAEDEARRAFAAEAPADAPRVSRAGRIAAFGALGAAPLAAVLLYLNLGAPQALTAPREASAAPAASLAGGAIATLEARVQASPDDFAAWMALGDAYASADRADDAARAFGRAVEIRGNDANAHSAFGEALVLQSSGMITKEARDAFSRALELAPGDPRARYYLAEARYQVGAIDEAVKAWGALLNDAPVDAPWFGAIAARMSDAAAEAGVALADVGLSENAMRRLAAADAAPPAAAAPAGGFDGAIGRIHDGGASFDDWILAASTYAERGEKDRAQEILDRAEARYERAPFVLAQIKKAKEQLAAGQKISFAAAPAAGVGGPGAAQVDAISALPEGEQRQMIEGMVAGLAERLKSNPDNPEGWRMLGRSYRVLGRPADSVDAWRELLKRGDAGAEDWRQYAFAMMDLRPQGDNSVTPELEAALVKLQSFNPDDPLALYNLGHAARNRGDKAKALALWMRLQQTLPPDTPLAPTLSRLIAETK